jgi:photosystem II stability/assembly factor-like uncharacterized protein
MKALIATRKGLFECELSAGRLWQIRKQHFLGEPVTMVLHDATQDNLYAALNLGHFGVKLHRCDNARAADSVWQEITVPAYPPQPESPDKDVEWKLKQIWALEGDAQCLWAGTLPGGLFQSSDRGASWQLVQDLWDKPGRKGWFGGGYDVPGIHSICVHPSAPQRILVGISCGGVWQSEDQGKSWELTADGMRATYMPPELAADGNTQDPHKISQCLANPDVLWCQHHNGIWRSADHGRHWQQLSTAQDIPDFGFAVAAHPQDANTAWFVPAKADQQRIPADGALSVTRTRDGGQSFETLRKGLPQQHCYDLIYRHGLAVAPDGKTLMIGSTTGNLWTSHNGGDDWQKVDANFPPIYAVKFFA